MLWCLLLVCVTAVTADLNYRDDIEHDAKLKVPELVRKYGYPLEEHQVQTSDGYLLTMHRIPHGKDNHQCLGHSKPVVFIMHGLMSSSADWVIMGPGKGLGYILADEGYDVWMGNARGNRYSRAHIILDPDDSHPDFWHFSWDEIGNKDLPAMIDYALEKTGKQKLHYIGHSQGTTSFFVMGSLRADYNQRIISMHALAPVAYMGNSGNCLMKAIAPLSNTIDCLLDVVGIGEFFPTDTIMSWAGQNLCRDEAVTQELCSNIIFLMGGWNSFQLNLTMLPVNLGHVPAGASVHQFAHYGQSISGKEFRRFNHGWWRNRKVYGTLKAPLYDLSQVKAPVYLHYSLADLFAHVDDVLRLWNNLGNPVEKIIVPMSSFSHLDFVWGTDAKKLVYDKVIEIMDSYNEKVDSCPEADIYDDDLKNKEEEGRTWKDLLPLPGL